MNFILTMVCFYVFNITFLSDFLTELKIFWKWSIQLEEIPHRRVMVEAVLICCKEIGLPGELTTLLINFFGPAFKILKLLPVEDTVDTENSRPTKRQKTLPH